MNTGDKIEELIEEELVDLDWDKKWGPGAAWVRALPGDEQKLYTFRTAVPAKVGGVGGPEAEAITARKVLLGYERVFRVLGDMEAGEEE